MEQPPFKFSAALVPPTGAVYIPPGTAIAITIITSLTARVSRTQLQRLLPSGRIQTDTFPFTHTGSGTPESTIVALSESFILSINVDLSGTNTRRGELFYQLQILRSTGPPAPLVQTLLQNYLTTTQTISYPLSRILDPYEGPARTVTQTPAVPGAGAEWTITVPANQRWRVRAIRMTLVTAAAGVARRVHVLHSRLGVVINEWQSNDDQAVADTRQHQYHPQGFQAAFVSTTIYGDMHNFYAEPLDVISSSTQALNAADQYSAIVLNTERWLS